MYALSRLRARSVTTALLGAVLLLTSVLVPALVPGAASAAWGADGSPSPTASASGPLPIASASDPLPTASAPDPLPTSTEPVPATATPPPETVPSATQTPPPEPPLPPAAVPGPLTVGRTADAGLDLRATYLADTAVRVDVQRHDGTGWVAVPATQATALAVRLDPGEGAAHLVVQPDRIGRWTLRLVLSAPGRSTVTTEPATVTVGFELSRRRATRADVPVTYRPGCPVGPSALQVLTFTYQQYDGTLHRGTLIVHDKAVAVMSRVFAASLAKGFRFKQITPPDWYFSTRLKRTLNNDPEAMAHGLTSAFFCRKVTGNPYRMSPHTWGTAIDINTFENPYLIGRRIYPPAAAKAYHVDRSKHLADPGVITDGSVVAKTFRAAGWRWGKYAFSQPDYQHFQP